MDNEEAGSDTARDDDEEEDEEDGDSKKRKRVCVQYISLKTVTDGISCRGHLPSRTSGQRLRARRRTRSSVE